MGYWFEPPTISIQKGKVIATLPSAITATVGLPEAMIEYHGHMTFLPDYIPLAQIYCNYIQLAVLVLEPLMMGAVL